MTDTIAIVTEVALLEADARHLANFYQDQDVVFEVFAPADTIRNRFTEFLNHLAHGEFGEAMAEITDPQTPQEATEEARSELTESLTQLRTAGLSAQGRVAADNPIPEVKALMATTSVRELVVVTDTRPVQDTFRADLASKLREAIELPVLHMYTGTLELG